jgi:dipeptidyl aminopeptidase/acylaminoacyl peptidase
MTTPEESKLALWKERFRTPEISYARIAHQNPARGLVIANIDQTQQLYAWEVGNKQTRALTDLPGGVGFAEILSDGSGMIYHHDKAGEELGHYHLVSFDGSQNIDLTPDLPEYSRAGWSTAAACNHIALGCGLDDVFQIFVQELFDLSGNISQKLVYSSKEIAGWPRLSPDGHYLVLITAEFTTGSRFSLVVVDVETGEQIGSLFDGEAVSIESIGFSPVEDDYRILAFTDKTGFVRPLIWDPLSGHREDLEFPDLEGDLKPLDWAEDGRAILFMQIHRAVQTLFSYQLESQELQIMDTMSASLGYGGGWYGYEGFYKPDGNIVALLQDAETPGHLVEFDPGTGERFGDLLFIKEPPKGGKWVSVEFKSGGGISIQGWLGKPKTGTPPYPAIIHTHGGPEGVMTNAYYQVAQAWMDHGFAFITINYRGSTTFGKDFKESIWGQPGTYEVEDIVAARDWLVEQGIADPGKVFLTGYSYGGYLTLQAMGKAPGLWAGGLALAAISDWVQCHELSNPTLRAYIEDLFLGSPEERPEAWKAASPITYAENFDAAILIIQGSNDSRTPGEPIRVFEKELKELGKDVQVHWFEAGHLGPTNEQWIGFMQLMLDFANR